MTGPGRCPHCAGEQLPVAYGYPPPWVVEAADRGEVVLGGCTWDPGDPAYACPHCQEPSF